MTNMTTEQLKQPSDLFPLDVWSIIMDYLPLEDKMRCRQVCTQLKTTVESNLKRQDRLWIRNRIHSKHVQCFEPNHAITTFDSISHSNQIKVRALEVLSSLMPSLKILR